MLFASVRMAPPGGRLRGFSRAGAKRQPGLIDLVVRDDWLAALGETWWAADRALTRAAPRFTGRRPRRSSPPRSPSGLDSGKAKRLFERGDYEGATKDSRPLSATYSIAADAASLARAARGGSALHRRPAGGLGRRRKFRTWREPPRPGRRASPSAK